MARTEVTVNSERNLRKRDPDDRAQPFFSVLLTGLVVVPLFGVLLRFIIFCAPEVRGLVGWFCVMLGVLVGGFALAYNLRVAKRDWLVGWHVAISAVLFGSALYTTVNVRWPAQTADVWHRLLAVVNWPAWWVVIHLFGSLIVSLSWLLYRLDSFRSSTASSTGEDSSGLAALVNWPKGAKVLPSTIQSDEFAVTAEIEHDGIPVARVQSAVKAVEENPNFIRGRSTVVPGEKGGRSLARLVHSDPHQVWRTWPGLSHPGGRYHEPLRTSYYSTGEVQWYSFVRTPDGYKSSQAPGFASPNATFKGAQGMTSSGKSGEAAIEVAEVLSRWDAQVIYVDTAKLLQNADWCLDACALAAGSRPDSRALFAALRRLGEVRSRLLGNAGIRDFDHVAVDKLGLSWLHIFGDEFDVASQGEDVKWLATKGRSLGMRLSLTLPRATGENMDTNIRGAIGMWAQFGISQDYDKGFVLSAATMEAGADPERFGIDVPGAHYLDKAPGIPRQMWAIDCRSFKTRQDFSDLKQAVTAARASFTRTVQFLPEELEALGDVAVRLRPAAVRAGHLGQDEPPPDDPTPTIELPAGEAAALEEGGTPVQLLRRKLSREDIIIDPATRELLDQIPDPDLTEMERQVGALDGRTAAPAASPDDGIDSALPHVKPVAPNRAEAIKDFENALIRLADENVMEFGNQDVHDRMKYEWAADKVSARFTELTKDATLNPPGLVLERKGRGRFTLTRIGGAGVVIPETEERA